MAQINEKMYKDATARIVRSKSYSLELERVISRKRTVKSGEFWKEELVLVFKDPDTDRLYEVQPSIKERAFIIENTKAGKDGREQIKAWHYKHFFELIQLAMIAGCPADGITKTEPLSYTDRWENVFDVEQYVNLLNGMKGKRIGVTLKHNTVFKKKLVNCLNGRTIPREDRCPWDNEDVNNQKNTFIQNTTIKKGEKNPETRVIWTLDSFYDVVTGKTWEEINNNRNAEYVDAWEIKQVERGDYKEKILSNDEISELLKKTLMDKKKRENDAKKKGFELNWGLLDITDDDFDHESLVVDDEDSDDGMSDYM